MASLFEIRRRQPELIRPACPTPSEFKNLSDIDDQDALRFQIRILLVYGSDVGKSLDPVRLVRDGLAKALLFYYPLAGRLKERSQRKLVVDCTGEGVLFVEGDADFSVDRCTRAFRPSTREAVRTTRGSEPAPLESSGRRRDSSVERCGRDQGGPSLDS
ncbi:hypothetical protein MLD38_032371 [Melastoma candidum]|uniref:Uncharacterized protein n=1 Tax=Melastoma candidum TaxID=119954 RepID=A0ACB9M410_9MYRT|nr:hypothetical protein MLD38_032371 [Melastoma candidum]